MPLAVPTLTVVDNQDGTATFTVADGDAAAVNDIKVTTLQQPLGWTSVGTLNGNVSNTFNVAPGCYWCCAFATKAAESTISLPIDAIFTTAPSAIFEQVLQAVVSKIQGAADLGAFGSMDNTRVVRQDVVMTERLSCGLPCIIVTPGLQESEGEWTNQSTDIVYPVMVGIYDAKEDKEEGNTASYFLWRENLRQLFDRKHLPGINRSVIATVVPQVILDHKDSAEDLYGFASSLQLLFTVREQRWA